MRKIVLYPDKVLREVTPVVTKVDNKLLSEIEDLKEVLLSKRSGAAGLAATQLGIVSRFFGELTRGKKEVDLYINPRIVATFGQKTFPIIKYEDGGEEDFLEGCLSFPNLFGTVKRYLRIEVEWDQIEDNKSLKSKKKTMEGIEAIVFQHELDHLDGTLFTDHVKEDKGKFYKFVGEKQLAWDIDKVVRQEK